jgi:hypothetical protein
VVRAFIDNRFYLILLVIVLMRFKYASYRSMWMCFLVNILGTFLHELMHFTVGMFLNAQPVNFNLIPKKEPGGNYVMGSVGFKNITFYNAIPSALAPLLLLPLGFYLNRYLLPLIEPTFINYVGYVFMQTIIIENAVPSSADFKIAGMFLKGIALYGILAIALLLAL